MEFQGRIAKLLPLRQGVSQRTGNEWKALPFVFEYFENQSDRYADSVVLETFDESVINNLKEGMEVRCGFGHRTREYQDKVYNEVRLYKIESIKKAKQADGGVSTAPNQQHSEAPSAQASSTQKQDGNVDWDKMGQDGNDLPF